MRILSRLISSLVIGIAIYSKLEATDVLIEEKAGYFIPTNKTFQRIYGEGGGIYGVEISCQTRGNFYLFLSGNYFTKTGRSIGEHDRTRVTLVPVALGLKYIFSKPHIDFYLGAGVVSTYLHTKDHSSFVIKSVSKWGLGGTWKAGFILSAHERLFLDIFADYTYMKIDFHNTDNGRVVRTDANVSGASVGGGIGYRF